MTASYPKYVSADSEWIDTVPASWRVGRLDQVARAWPSNVDKHSVADQPPVRLCNYTDVYKNDSIVEDMKFMVATASPEQISRFKIAVGDTILTKDSETADDIGIPAYVEYEAPDLVCGYHLSIVRPIPGIIESKFLFWALGATPTTGQWAVLASGVTRVGIKAGDLAKATLALPPIDEQRAIADYLDRETARIDTLIGEQQRLIETLRERRRSAISGAVARGLDETVGLKDSGLPGAGPVPMHWEVVPLRYTLSFQEGPGIMAADFRDGGVPLLRVSCVRAAHATLEGCNYLDPDEVDRRWSHFRVDRGDLLISASASMGTVSEVTEETAGSVPYTGIIRIKPGRMQRDFIRWFVVSGEFIDQVDSLKTGSTIQHFGPTHLAQMRVALPPADEQRQIAAYVDEQTLKIDTLIAETERFIELSRERRSALIAAAVTGQIDVRETV